MNSTYIVRKEHFSFKTNVTHSLSVNEIFSDSKEKNPQEAKPLKEGVLFDCTFKVFFGKEGEDKGKLSLQEPLGR